MSNLEELHIPDQQIVDASGTIADAWETAPLGTVIERDPNEISRPSYGEAERMFGLLPDENRHFLDIQMAPKKAEDTTRYTEELNRRLNELPYLGVVVGLQTKDGRGFFAPGIVLPPREQGGAVGVGALADQDVLKPSTNAEMKQYLEKPLGDFQLSMLAIMARTHNASAAHDVGKRANVADQPHALNIAGTPVASLSKVGIDSKAHSTAESGLFSALAGGEEQAFTIVTPDGPRQPSPITVGLEKVGKLFIPRRHQLPFPTHGVPPDALGPAMTLAARQTQQEPVDLRSNMLQVAQSNGG